MVQGGEQPRLPKQFAEVQRLPVRHFERDALVDPGVFRQIDRAETTAAERLEDPVLAERLSAKHHSGESIRQGRQGSVLPAAENLQTLA